MNKDTFTNGDLAPEEAIRERKRRILSPKSLVFLALSIVILIYLLRNIDITATLSTFANADPWLLLASCGAYLLSNLCKSVRYHVMLRGMGLAPFQMFAITSYQNFFNQILPARTGELTLIYYLKKVGGASLSRGLHILVVTRIYDLIIVAMFFLASVLAFYGSAIRPGLLVIGGVCLGGSVASLFFLKYMVIFADRAFIGLARLLRIDQAGLVVRIREKAGPVVREFSDYRTARQLPLLVLSSVAVWAVLYVFAYLTILAFRVDVGFVQAVVGNTGQVLANVLPVNSFGSFGTLEAGWAGGFMLVGMNSQDAITTAFGYHIINFVASGLIAAASWAVLALFGRRRG
ncbi:MAG: lysylphosphatidylglycerol synthase transmembrane domain-containing protein [Spirochaetota bacterium]|nr:lysylphosphatidylglycerol synthase transmembrane domain-containing protein [Spirochaetota bacterium]OPZ37329.1 MAG: hypothetical protein BWY96_01742 [Spirochaetes bacterium ADurb.BinA120]HPI13898.1 lysylphosphatidylglycerol synthase transmembrane domain-containing protein [Spirochaetota bacterium]